MCKMGSWRSFTRIHIQNDPYAVQQCTECGSHRAVSLLGMKVLQKDRSASQRSVDPDDDTGSESSSDSDIDLPDPEDESGDGSVWSN
jgi:hypothetical protein